MHMETNRLILRPFTPDDWKDLYEYLSKEEVVRFEPYSVFDEESCRNEAVNRSGNEAFLAVCLKNGGKVIGNVYFQKKEPTEFLTWEIGYVFNPDYYGKGYATEAAARMLRYGFEELHAHRIVAGCNTGNAPSWRLLERLSMRREATFEKAAFFKRNKAGEALWFDSFSYAIREDEYRQEGGS